MRQLSTIVREKKATGRFLESHEKGHTRCEVTHIVKGRLSKVRVIQVHALITPEGSSCLLHRQITKNNAKQNNKNNNIKKDQCGTGKLLYRLRTARLIDRTIGLGLATPPRSPSKTSHPQPWILILKPSPKPNNQSIVFLPFFLYGWIGNTLPFLLRCLSWIVSYYHQLLS